VIFIDLNGKEPPQEWLDRAEAARVQLLAIDDPEERKEFIEAHAKIWRDLAEWLKEQSHRKCWYSEAKETFSYWHVDHFRPKKKAKDLEGNETEGYWWLAFDWHNYRLAGSAGNVPKSTYFPLRPGCHRATGPTEDVSDEEPCLLDPTRLTDPALLSFDDEGKIRPADPDGAWNKERAEMTIKVLNLNYGDLVSARKALWEQCNRKINRVLNLMKELQDRRSATKQAQVEEILIDLRNMVSQTEPFSAVVATCVRSQGISWLNKAVVG
jgi:uncharacterized protein (TIGR02646 family)